MSRWPYSALLLSFLLAPGLARAHPVSYKDALSVMTWNQPSSSDWLTTYTFLRRTAAAARYLRFETEEGQLRAYLPQVNHRLYRWNMPDAQANIYLSGGYGRQELEDRVGAAGLADIEADHESRRHLVAFKGSALFNSEGPNVWWWEARAGLAPYLSEFDEPSGWFIVAVQHNPQMEPDVNVVPMIRMFYHNVLGELGAGSRGDWALNLMVHF
ncbi:MAG: hypothetical protein ACT4O3_08415 [Elusimicrobiota bacterium]